ncbi:hypothetical protein Q7P37_007918 [Cladosporium fusiforme]
MTVNGQVSSHWVHESPLAHTTERPVAMELTLERLQSGRGRSHNRKDSIYDPEKTEDLYGNTCPPPPPSRASFKDRIAHFTWLWFATTMSTGAIALLLASTPNTFPGLMTIGKIFFIFNLALFAIFNLAMLLRAYWFPRRFLASFVHPVEGLFFGSYWVSVSMHLNCMQMYGVPSTGNWLVQAILVLFWTYCGMALVTAVVQYYILFQGERLKIADAIPAWMFPIYPLITIGPMAGSMIQSQSHYNALPMWLGAVMLQGLAWMVSLMMYSLYMQRLMTSALPAPSVRPGMYMSVGPAAYTAAGLIKLGIHAPNVLYTDAFTMNPTPDGDVVRVIGTMAGIFVVLFAFWFFCISTVAVLAGARRMAFTLNWWAFVFPNVGLTLAMIQVGEALNSKGINGVCSAMTVMLVVTWFITAVAHIRALCKGKIMWPGKDEDKDMPNLGWGSSSA